MITVTGRRRPAPATLVLLGLLALLLWGQCAVFFHDSKAPVALHNFYARVYQVNDVIPGVTARAATIYLTLEFSNYLPQASTLDTVRGAVQFEGRQWAFSATRKTKGLLLAAGQTRLVAVAVPLVPLMPADSLLALRAVLRKGSTGSNSLRLKLYLTYFTSDEPTMRKTSENDTYLPRQLP